MGLASTYHCHKDFVRVHSLSVKCEDSEYWLTRPETVLDKIEHYLMEAGCSVKRAGPSLHASCPGGCEVTAEVFWVSPSRMIERLGTVGYEAIASGFGAVRVIIGSPCRDLCERVVSRALMVGGG